MRIGHGPKPRVASVFCAQRSDVLAQGVFFTTERLGVYLYNTCPRHQVLRFHWPISNAQPAMAAAYTSRDMVEDYLRYKLLNKGVNWRTPPPAPLSRRSEESSSSSRRSARGRTSHRGVATDHAHTDSRLPPPRVQVALRCAGDALQQRHGDNLSSQASLLLQCGDGSSAERRRNMSRVREQLFRDGVNWGRIVAMMELGGSLSIEVVRTGSVGQVDDIARWLEESLDSPQLQEWIEDNGGWDAFVELYGDSRPWGSYWTPRTVFALVALGAVGITLAALFSQK